MAEVVSKFKANSGNWYTRGLVYEWAPDKSSVLYTIKDQDHAGYPSLKRLYFELSDPTEYIFANTYLGGWEHWLIFQECHWFKPVLKKWRYEFALKLKADHLAKIIQTARGNGKEALSAARYLVERGWEKDIIAIRGRPSKEQIHAEAKLISDTYATRLEEDLLRIQPVLERKSSAN